MNLEQGRDIIHFITMNKTRTEQVLINYLLKVFFTSYSYSLLLFLNHRVKYDFK